MPVEFGGDGYVGFVDPNLDDRALVQAQRDVGKHEDLLCAGHRGGGAHDAPVGDVAPNDDWGGHGAVELAEGVLLLWILRGVGRAERSETAGVSLIGRTEALSLPATESRSPQ